MHRLESEKVDRALWAGYFPGRGKSAVSRHWGRIRTREIKAHKKEAQEDAAQPGPSSDDFQGDTWTATRSTAERITTLDDLVRFCRIDIAEWEIVRWTCNKWEVGAKDKDKKVRVTPLFQVKAVLKKRTNVIDARELIAKQIADAKKHAPNYPALMSARPEVNESDGHMLVISVPDAHLGKLVWQEECGEAYDLKAAISAYEDAVAVILDRAQGTPLSKIVLVFGNDLVNVDNSNDTTFAGTQQHSDSRHAKIRRAARQMLVRVIELCMVRAEVRAVFVPGNHDPDTIFGLGEAIECWFHDCPGVRVDNTPPKRKYFRFGKVLLMWTHGNFEKHERLPLIMATERPEEWGHTLFREVHTGHYHQRKSMTWLGIQEHCGVVVRILPSLCPPDTYHTDHGYVGNIRAAEGYIYHPERGLVSTITHAVTPVAA